MSSASPQDNRLHALRRFAIGITVLNILGHFWFGFEQSFAQPLVALATTYSLELALEALDARLQGRRPRFAGGFVPLVNSLLSAHISGLAVAMLLYANERLWPIAFAAAVAIASKHVFQAPLGGRMVHFFNPSNFGITVTLLTLTWVSAAAPYMFTENLGPVGDWILPGFIIVAGSAFNTFLSKRILLIASWLGCFALQATLRALIFGTPLAAGFVPMTGVAFILFTFYMVTDPATTPSTRRGQVLFGASVALAYFLLIVAHIVFDLFLALSAVCAVRGAGLWAAEWLRRSRARGAGAPITAAAAERTGL